MLRSDRFPFASWLRPRPLRQWFRADDSGQSLLEFALLVPLFTAILLGAGELARVSYAGIEVTNAARAGVQYGAQTHATAADTNGIKLAATSDGANLGTLAANVTVFCTCSNGTAITCANAATNCSARTFQYVQVDTSVTLDPLIHAPALPKSYSLKGRSVMRVQQ